MKNRDWKEVRLGEICLKITDGSHFSPVEQTEGYIMLSSKDMEENGFDYSDVKYISKEDYLQLVKNDCKPLVNDVLIIKDGNSYLQRIFLCKEEKEQVILSSIAIVRPNVDKVYPPFLSYKLKSPQTKAETANLVSGSAIPRIILDDFKKVKISLPPLPTQQKIADTLGAYDELIENNRRRMALLENMAAGLYKEWFVRMRPHGQTLPTNPETGLPEGWEVVNLKKISFANQKSVANFDDNAVISYVDISSVGKGIINDMTTYNFSDAPGRARRIVRHGDTIFSTVRPENKAYALILTPPENLIVSTGFIVLSPLKEHFTYFIYHLVSNESFIEEVSIKAKGSAYPQIGNDDFMEINFVLPTEKTLKQFHSFADPIFNQIKTLQEQTGVLRRMRDRLLPRLMSGELGG